MFKNGFFISGFLCYQESTPYSEPTLCNDVLYQNENVRVERVWEWDVNALYEAGFIIEKMVEQTDEKSLADTEDNSPKAQKAKMVPLSMCFKCRKL